MKKLIALLFCLATSPLMFAQQLPVEPSLKATVRTLAQIGTTSHEVDLSWGKSPTASVSVYNVYRSNTAGVCAFPNPVSTTQAIPSGCTKIGTSTTLVFVDSSAAVQAENSTFKYVVTATSLGGESAGTNEASATIPFSLTQPPTNLQALPK